MVCYQIYVSTGDIITIIIILVWWCLFNTPLVRMCLLLCMITFTHNGEKQIIFAENDDFVDLDYATQVIYLHFRICRFSVYRCKVCVVQEPHSFPRKQSSHCASCALILIIPELPS